jgi:hypothetical protein
MVLIRLAEDIIEHAAQRVSRFEVSTDLNKKLCERDSVSFLEHQLLRDLSQLAPQVVVRLATLAPQRLEPFRLLQILLTDLLLKLVELLAQTLKIALN